MKKSKLFIISSVALLFAIAGLTVYAFYNFFYKNNGSTLSLVEVVFSVNDSNVKNKNDVVYFSTDDMSQGDGYEIVLNYSINGSFSSTNAVRYSTYFQSLTGGIDGERNIANGVEVYRFNGENYEYLDNLGNLISQTTPVMTDYLGSTGTNREKFMLVYGEATVVENRVPFGLQISTTSEVVATDAEKFPYYYLANLGKNSAESILEQLPKNSAVYGRTIVLTKDINYQGGDITFDHVVGIDLNGHTLNLNGAKLTIKDTANGSEPFLTDLAIIDSKDSGSVTNGTITLNLSKTVMDVDTELLSYVTVSNINMSIFEERLQNSLNDIASQKRLMNTESNDTFSYHFDALRGLKFYVKKGTVSVAISGSDESVSYNSSDCTFDVTGLETSNIVYVAITATKSGSDPAIANANLSLYGKSLQDAAEYLMNYVPKVIEGSIYLPQYLPKFNAYVTWISFDDDLINSNGTVLQNGYINLDSWVSKNTKLGFVLDQSGEIKNGIIDNITIQVLSEEERAKLLHDHSITMFDYQTITSYSFNVVDVLLYKREVDFSVANQALFNKIKEIATNEFGITLETAYDSSNISGCIATLKDEFKTKIFTKLGIEEINVSAINEASLYVTNEKDINDNIVSVRQISLPKDTIDLVYNVNYVFESGNTVTEHKTIDVSNGEATTTATDVANTIRVPFDTYTRTMTNPIYTSPYVYASFVDTFEIVSDFSGAQISYQVDDEFKDYVEIITTGEGASLKKFVHIITSKSPAETTDVKVYYTIGDVTNYVTFKLVGILHNGIEIKDANLYVELLAQFDVNKDNILTILEAEHADGETFEWSGKGIVSIQGLRYFTNIKKLTMNKNKLIDIDDLAYLKDLYYIELRNNYITDISSLSYLDNLTTINLRNNQITDISSVQYLSKLENLYLEFNRISDFQYVQNLTALKNLRVFNNYNSAGKTTIGTDSSDEFTILRRSNQYYFSLLKAKRGNSCNIYITKLDDSKRTETGIPGVTSFNNNVQQEALILNKIVPVSEIYNVISLPTYVNNNTNYEITYTIESSDAAYVKMTRESDIHLQKIEIVQIPVDNEVSIYAYTVGLDGASIYRKITFVILEGGDAGQIQLMDENGDTFYAYANVVIPDLKLRAELFKNFDENNNGIITNSELTASKEVNLEFAGVESLEGLQYFTSITSLNLRGNVLSNIKDLWYVSYLQNLLSLKIDGQRFDFDYLVYFSSKDIDDYEKNNKNTFVVTGIDENDHNVLGTYGLTSLTSLYVNGSYNLDDYDIKTELYHVYLNNSVDIYMQDDSTVWDPIKEEVSKLIGSMTTSATFINLYDQIELSKTYTFYLYDDILPIEFTLTFNKPTDTYYRNQYGDAGKDPVKTLYYIGDNSTKTASFAGSVVGNNGTIGTSKFFMTEPRNGGKDFAIIYERLSAFDLTTYAKMSLTSNSSLWNNKSITASTIDYYMALNVQYNDNYVLYNDIDENDPINNDGKGTPLNKIFGSTETMIFVIDGLTSQFYGNYRGARDGGGGVFNSSKALRPFYYSLTDKNGKVTYYYRFGADSPISYTNKEDAIKEIVKYKADKSIYYDGAIQTNKVYENGFRIYVSQLKKDFKYNNSSTQADFFKYNPVILYLCMKTNYAELVTDGLQYLPFVEGVQVSNGLKYGDGSTLVNIKTLADIYGYTNLSTISTPLPNLEGLYLNKICMSDFASERGTSDSDPTKLISSYLVYMPNLRTFFVRTNPEAGQNGTPVTDWSAFLAYAYIPYGQTIDSKYNKTDSVDKDDTLIGGMQLQDNNLYYYDPSRTIDSCFVMVYDAYGDPLDVTDYTIDSLTQVSNNHNYYDHLYDENGNALSDTISLFRKSQKNQFNYLYVRQGGINTGTVNQKIAFTQVYNNSKDTVISWYFKLMGTNGDGGGYNDLQAITSTTTGVKNPESDWDPEMVEVTYEPTTLFEWSELNEYLGHLDVKLTGQMYNGTSLNNDTFDSINWNSLDYVDLFKNGLVVKLPTKTTEYLTGDTLFDNCREYPITWKLFKLEGSNIVSEDISTSNATLNGDYYEYTFGIDGYYILVSKVNGENGLMYSFSITNKAEANFSEWYECVKDKTLKYLVFQSGGSNATSINFSSIGGINNLDASIVQKYYCNVYTLEGIDSLASLTNLQLNNFLISYIPTLPSLIQTLDLSGNQIGDIGNILDGSSYNYLTTVDISNNYLDLKEANFKNGSYYSTNITSLKIYGPSNHENFYDSTIISYFNGLTYNNPISIYFRSELMFSYYNGNVNAIPYQSLASLKTLVNKNNATIYAYVKNRWYEGNGGIGTLLSYSKIVDLEKAYAAVGNPSSKVSLNNISSGYSLDSTYGVNPTVSYVNSQNGIIYEKMIKAYYLVLIDMNEYTVVKELFGQFADEVTDYNNGNASVNGISIQTLQNSIDHRILEDIYSKTVFGGHSSGYAGDFSDESIDLSYGSIELDLKGLNQFSTLKTINSYNGSFSKIINYSVNTNITKINMTSNFALIKSITDSNGIVEYTFQTPVSRDLVNINNTATFVYNSFSPLKVEVNDKYNYCLTNTFKIDGLKTRIYQEITGNNNVFYSKLGVSTGDVANLTSLHIVKGISYYGAKLYSNSAFKQVENGLINVLRYGINVDTDGKRTLTNGANMSYDINSNGKRYVILEDTSEIHFPKTMVLNGETITFTYSSSEPSLGLNPFNDGTDSYIKMTSGDISSTTNGILITVSYSSTSYSGSFYFYVDVKTGSNASNDSYFEAITNWYVEMQDGSLVHAGDVFSSAVLTSNIFNGIARVIFGTEVVTDMYEGTSVSPDRLIINGNLIMDEVLDENGSMSKVLRQNVIKQVKSIRISDRVVMYFDGLEIFYNCKSLQLDQSKKGGAGYDCSFASNMQLESFMFYTKRNSITIQDFSFLNNSRDTLRYFMYGGIKDNSSMPLQDMSWLLAFDNLEKVELKGATGIQYNPSFQYFLTAMYMKYHSDKVTYNSSTYSNLNIPDYIKSAATIMYNLSSFDTSNDSSFVYQNGFELFSKDGKIEENKDYYIPSYLYSAGDYYKIQWNSLSSFVDISVIHNDSVITIAQYENQYKEWKKDNPNLSDYDFCKDYTIKIRFKNLASTTSYKAFISMKIEYESKFNDVYAPVITTITDMSTNYSNYYKASYSALENGTEFAKNKYYYNDNGDYKLLLVEPDDWSSNASNYYDKIYTVCESNEIYNSGTTYYTRFIYEPHMFERILTINLGKNNQYKQVLINKDGYSNANYVQNNANVYDGTAISGDYTSVVSSNPSVIDVVEHNITVAETHYFIVDGNNIINVNSNNYSALLSTYTDSRQVFYYFVGRVVAGVTYDGNSYYKYDSSSYTYTKLSAIGQPSDWANTTSNYYSFTTNIDGSGVARTTLGAIADELNVTTKVYGIYLKDPTYTGLVTITCTLSDGTTEEYYVYWER